MKRYIEVNALMEYCLNQKSKTISNNDIARFPTADVVEVVRCKDCKHRTELPYVDKDTHEPIYDCGYNISAIWGEENGYCNHGERRE